MILDIRYWEKSPEQIQNVRYYSLYPHSDGDSVPFLTIQFYNFAAPSRTILLREIKNITATND